MRLWPFHRPPAQPRGDAAWRDVAPLVPAAARPLPVAAAVLTTPRVAGAEVLVPLVLPVTPADPVPEGDDARAVPAQPLPDEVSAERRDAPTWPADEEADGPDGGGQDLAGVIAMLDAQVTRRDAERSAPPDAPPTHGTATMLRPTLAESRRRGLGAGTHGGRAGPAEPPVTASPAPAEPVPGQEPPVSASPPPGEVRTVDLAAEAASDAPAPLPRPAPRTAEPHDPPVPAGLAPTQPPTAPTEPRDLSAPPPPGRVPPRPARTPTPAPTGTEPAARADAGRPTDQSPESRAHTADPGVTRVGPPPPHGTSSPEPDQAPSDASSPPSTPRRDALTAPGREAPELEPARPSAPAPGAPTARPGPAVPLEAPRAPGDDAGRDLRHPPVMAPGPEAEPAAMAWDPVAGFHRLVGPPADDRAEEPLPEPVPPDVPLPATPARTAPVATTPATPLPAHRPARSTAADGRLAEPAPPRTALPRIPVPATTRADPVTVASFGRLTGVDLGFVPVVRSAAAGREAAARSARAFTENGVVHLPPDEIDPDRADAAALLGHELTHVLQQRALGAAADEDGPFGDLLEAEAREVERALRGEQPAPHPDSWSWSGTARTPYRRSIPETGPSPVTDLPGTGVQRAPLAAEAPPPAAEDTAPQPATLPPTVEAQPLVYPGERDLPAPGSEVEAAPAPPALTEEDVLRLVDRRQPRMVAPEVDLADPGLLDTLAVSLYGRIRRQLRGELLADRERAGCLTEFH